MIQRAAIIVFAALAAGHLLAPPASAQTAATKQSSPSTNTGPPNALQGFSQNRDKPIRIDAERLEVRDKSKVATFFGDAKADVKVVQGDVTMRSKILVVYYDRQDDNQSGTGAAAKAASGGAPAPAKAASPAPGGAAPGPGSGSQIRRMEAKGGVIVTQKDQTVTGDLGVFDTKTNTATVTGNVVMTQCESVLRGERLVVDMTTGVSQVEGGRVTGLLQSQSNCAEPAPAPAAPAKKSAGTGSSDKPPKSGK